MTMNEHPRAEPALRAIASQHGLTLLADACHALGGSLDGQTMDPAGINVLAVLPSLNELRGKIVGLVQAPATKIAGVLAAPAGQLARVLSARAKQSEAA